MGLLEDFESRVGEEIGVGDWFVIDQERIDAFAHATDDHQWIHVDPERAAAGPFGATIAHGYLVLSMIPAIVPGLDLDSVRMGINYGLDRVRFISPVRAGSRIRARSKVLEVHEAGGGVQVKTEVTLELEGSDKPACVAETIARLYP